jgi:hypothetical protein
VRTKYAETKSITTNKQSREVTMARKLRYITPLLAAGAAAAAIAAAPIAAAADQQSCTVLGGSSYGIDTQCQSPGNVQIRNNPVPQFGGGFSTYGPFFNYDRGRR